MLPLNSLTVGSHHVVRHSVPIHGDLFFGLLPVGPILFLCYGHRLSGLFCIYGSLYGIDLLFMGSMKVNRKKSHAGWQLPLTNYKYIANEPLFYWYQHNPLPLTLYVPRIISRIF